MGVMTSLFDKFCLATFSSLETKRSCTETNRENAEKFRRGDGGGVSGCVVMVEEDFFLGLMGSFFLPVARQVLSPRLVVPPH